MEIKNQKSLNIYDKIMAVLATLVLIWALYDVLALQLGSGKSDLIIGEWGGLFLAVFVWVVLALPLVKKLVVKP